MAQVVLWRIFLVLFLWIVINMINIKNVKSIPREDFTIGYKDMAISFGMKKGHLACQCGKLGKMREKDLEIKTAQKLFRAVSKDGNFLEKINNYKEVKEFADCIQCNLTYINCAEEPCVKKAIKFSLEKNRNRTGTTESIMVTESSRNVTNDKAAKILAVNNSKTNETIPSGFVPKVFDIPIGGHKNHSRSPRFIGCSYPSAMETAAISCRIYPSSIKCVQKCAFGFTLESGIRKDMQCKFKENRWTPSGFKECVPFVDCTVTLASGGSAVCSTASVEEAPVCKIECLAFEDKPQLPMALYRCKVDGTWEPNLPFCAIPGSGLMLAPPPRVKMHTDQEDQPKNSVKDKD